MSQTGSYQLNFNGRVLYSSARNFQLEHVREPDVTDGSSKSDSGTKSEYPQVFQFGRFSEKQSVHNVYTLDYKSPLSPVVAFAIALAQCSEKVVC